MYSAVDSAVVLAVAAAAVGGDPPSPIAPRDWHQLETDWTLYGDSAGRPFPSSYYEGRSYYFGVHRSGGQVHMHYDDATELPVSQLGPEDVAAWGRLGLWAPAQLQRVCSDRCPQTACVWYLAELRRQAMDESDRIAIRRAEEAGGAA